MRLRPTRPLPFASPAVGRGRQEHRSGVDRAGGENDDVRGVLLALAVAVDDDPGHLAAGRSRLEPDDARPGPQRDVRVRERRVDADHLRVGLAVDQARVAVARRAPDARGVLRRRVVAQDPVRQRERVQVDALEVGAQLGDPRLVGDRRERVGAAAGRLVLATGPADLVEILRLVVPGLQVGVRDRPRRRDPVDVPDPAEVALAQPEQDGTVDLRVAPDVVVLLGGERLAGRVVDPLAGVVVALGHPDLGGVPVLRLARQVVAAFEEQDPLPGWGQGVRHGAATGAAADDDDVEVFGHGCAPGARVG
jgi:hypothetical protein